MKHVIDALKCREVRPGWYWCQHSDVNGMELMVLTKHSGITTTSTFWSKGKIKLRVDVAVIELRVAYWRIIGGWTDLIPPILTLGGLRSGSCPGRACYRSVSKEVVGSKGSVSIIPVSRGSHSKWVVP